MIALAPEVQRRGVGTAVIRDVLRDAHRRRRAVVLRVSEENTAARRFCERLGFRVEGAMDEPTKCARKLVMVARPPD